MPHLIGKSGGTNPGEVIYNAPPSLLVDSQWKVGGAPGSDPNWFINLDGVIVLYDADVPAAHVKAVDIGGGIFQAQEKTPSEIDAQDLPGAKAGKLSEIDGGLQSTFDVKLSGAIKENWPQSLAHLAREKDDLYAQVAAASTVAQVQAIVVDYPDPTEPEPAASDILSQYAAGDSASFSEPEGWVKISVLTTQGLILGGSFSKKNVGDIEQNNYIRNIVDSQVELTFTCSATFVGNSSLEVAVGISGLAPIAAQIAMGAYFSGTGGSIVPASSFNPLVLSAGDFLEVWGRVSGNPGSSAILNRLSMSIRRIK